MKSLFPPTDMIFTSDDLVDILRARLQAAEAVITALDSYCQKSSAMLEVNVVWALREYRRQYPAQKEEG